VVARLLAVRDLVEKYVTACVNPTYSSDMAGAADGALQTWISTASAADHGNVRGLPRCDTRETLADGLTSLVYRITVHGISQLNSTANRRSPSPRTSPTAFSAATSPRR
jgi:hypothetical protein